MWTMGDDVEIAKGATWEEALENLKDQLELKSILIKALRRTFERILLEAENTIESRTINGDVTLVKVGLLPPEILQLLLAN